MRVSVDMAGRRGRLPAQRVNSHCTMSVERGRFRTHMSIELVNDGPVTLMLESAALASGEAVA